MLASPFAFLRGSAAVMASDLARTPNTGIEVQLCGDAHVANYGIFATPGRNLVFDLNDFDETHAGPFEWDVKRLAANVVVAARDRGFDPALTRQAARSAVGAYRSGMHDTAAMSELEVWYHRVDVDSLRPELHVLLSSYHLVDFARKVVGVGSVGTEAFIFLLVSGRERDVLILQ